MRTRTASILLRRLAVAGFAAGLALGLAGCVTEGPQPAAIDAGPDVPPGSNEDFIVNVGRRIYFSENSDQLTDTAKVTLDAQAEWLGRFPKYKVKIEGFADEKGSEAVNNALGLKRAEATRNYLAEKGVATARMRVKTFGNTRKVKDCQEIGCYAQNRRVITVLDVEGDT
jgi:peptidoglycan-associated lipoprotein